MVNVSVIVPVYKTEAYLRTCLDSLVFQDLEDVEILVVNDGSPDHSQAIIDEYQNKYPQVKGLIKENGGLSDARNYGLKHASGKYVAFVDSDDYVASNMLKTMFQKAEKDELDVVVCDTWMDYPDHSYVLKADLGYTDDVVKAYIISYPNAPARMIRKAFMEHFSFKKGIWYEDLQLMPVLAAYTQKIGFVNDPLYHYVQRSESIMNQKDFQPKFYDIFSVLEDVWQAFLKNSLTEKYFNELEYLYISQLQRSATLRFVGLDGSQKALEKINQIMKDRFPNWTKNAYLKKSSWKFKVICQLARFRLYSMINLLKKVG